jgi:hypothetical protein
MARYGEPPCDHRCLNKGMTGRVSWPPDLRPGGPTASAYVCRSDRHRRETAAWVFTVTGHLGEFVPMAQRTKDGAR